MQPDTGWHFQEENSRILPKKWFSRMLDFLLWAIIYYFVDTDSYLQPKHFLHQVLPSRSRLEGQVLFFFTIQLGSISTNIVLLKTIWVSYTLNWCVHYFITIMLTFLFKTHKLRNRVFGDRSYKFIWRYFCLVVCLQYNSLWNHIRNIHEILHFKKRLLDFVHWNIYPEVTLVRKVLTLIFTFLPGTNSLLK